MGVKLFRIDQPVSNYFAVLFLERTQARGGEAERYSYSTERQLYRTQYPTERYFAVTNVREYHHGLSETTRGNLHADVPVVVIIIERSRTAVVIMLMFRGNEIRADK